MLRLALILAALALAYVPKLVLWESFTASSAHLIGPGNPLDTFEKMLAALAGLLVSTFVLLYIAARAW